MSEQHELFKAAMAMDMEKKGADPWLADLFERQHALTNKLADKGKGPCGDYRSVCQLAHVMEDSDYNPKQVEDWFEALRGQVLCVMMESAEAMDWTPWKHWKTYDLSDPETVEKIRMEVAVEAVDMLHFVLNIFMLCGMGSGEVWKLYLMKHAENMRRVREGY